MIIPRELEHCFKCILATVVLAQGKAAGSLASSISDGGLGYITLFVSIMMYVIAFIFFLCVLEANSSSTRGGHSVGRQVSRAAAATSTEPGFPPKRKGKAAAARDVISSESVTALLLRLRKV